MSPLREIGAGFFVRASCEFQKSTDSEKIHNEKIIQLVAYVKILSRWEDFVARDTSVKRGNAAGCASPD